MWFFIVEVGKTTVSFIERCPSLGGSFFRQLSTRHFYSTCTVEPPNNRHYGANGFERSSLCRRSNNTLHGVETSIFCRTAVPISDGTFSEVSLYYAHSTQWFEPPNIGLYVAISFVPCRELVPISEVPFKY
jgi:hypothetical protein